MGLRHVRKGDLVGVIAGKFRGQSGKVVEVVTSQDPNRWRVRIEGIAIIKRHLKADRDRRFPQGGIVEKLGSVHISNVLPIDPSSNRPRRVGTRIGPDGDKVRYAKGSGEALPQGR